MVCQYHYRASVFVAATHGCAGYWERRRVSALSAIRPIGIGRDAMRRGTEADFWAKVNKNGPVMKAELGPCWQYLGKPTTLGYCKLRRRPKRSVMAHRYSYELLVGPIPEGLTLDHACKNRGCVNPAHLEPVPLVVNIMRGDSPHANNARKTHCPKGHPYDVNWPNIAKNGRSHRGCRICNIERARQWRNNRKKAQNF